jgi:hypothetical protein
MATVLYQSSQTNTAGNAASIDISKPASLAAGDLLVAVVSLVGGGGSIDTPAGWTSLGKNTVSFAYFAAFYKVADASDAAASSFTFSFSASATNSAGGIARFINGSASSPVDGTATADASSVSGYTPTQTMGTSLILAAGWNGGGNSGSFGSYAMGTGNPSWTEAFDTGIGTQKVGVAMAYGGRSGTAATGTVQYAASGYSSLKIWALNIAPGPLEALSLSSAVSPPASVRLGPLPSLALNASLGECAAEAVEPLWSNTQKSSAAWSNLPKS